jgi:integrative and conjugative element protein (TIGR02256 family)
LPGPVARHGSYSYTPDPEHDQEALARAYKRSGRLHTYLGDWHTHPDHAPHPSCKDIRTLAHIAAYPDARATRPLMLIIGGNPKSWAANLWCFDQRLVSHKIVLWNEQEQTDRERKI